MIVPILQHFRSYCSNSTLTTHGFTSATLVFGLLFMIQIVPQIRSLKD